MNYTIYRLMNPKSGKVWYIGITKEHILFRLCSHVRNCRDTKRYKNTPLSNWVKKIIKRYDRLPIIEAIEIVENKEKALKREKFWIEFYKLKNPKILNTRKTRYKEAISHKLNEEAVRKIRKLSKNGKGPTYLGKKFGVKSCTISNLIAGRSWKHTK